MATPNDFYSTPKGTVYINPALIRITDRRMATTPVEVLQDEVIARVHELLDHGLRTFHVDVNFTDYAGFGQRAPDMNASVFTAAFVAALGNITRARGAFVNLHLLTGQPSVRLAEYAHVQPGAVCFQLDAIGDPEELAELITQIRALDACASPVIETVGSESLPPAPPENVAALLAPVLGEIGMLTFQAATTASRTDHPRSMLAAEQVEAYLVRLRPVFRGTVQLQGGITTRTVAAAVRLGAQFLVCGTEIFNHPAGLPATVVVDRLLQAAGAAFGSSASRLMK